MGINGEQVVIVSDIGCSGLFDTFFNTPRLPRPARTGADLRNRHQDGPPGTDRHRHHGRRRPWHWRRPCAEHLPAQHRFDPAGAQQFQLRHDRRPMLLHNPPQDARVSVRLPQQARKAHGHLPGGRGRRCRPPGQGISTYDKWAGGQQLTAAIAFDGFSLLDIWGHLSRPLHPQQHR